MQAARRVGVGQAAWETEHEDSITNLLPKSNYGYYNQPWMKPLQSNISGLALILHDNVSLGQSAGALYKIPHAGH